MPPRYGALWRIQKHLIETADLLGVFHGFLRRRRLCNRLPQLRQHFEDLGKGIVILSAHGQGFDGEKAAVAAVVDDFHESLEVHAW